MTQGRTDSSLSNQVETNPAPKMGDTRPSLAKCEAHGDTEGKAIFIGGEWCEVKCPSCVAEKKDAEEAEQERRAKIEKAMKRQALVEKHLKRSGIPKRFQAHSLSTYHATCEGSKYVLKDCRDYAGNFPEMKKLGRCMIMTGTTGTGKTHLSCGIANHIIREHAASALFISAVDAVRHVKESFDRGCERTERESIQFFESPDLLILDEIGVQFGSDAEKMILFEIINKRYESVLPTIIMSNLYQHKQLSVGLIGSRNG